MAKKMCFMVKDTQAFSELIVEYEFVKGMAPSQRKKNVINLHSRLKQNYKDKKILEISTKSDISLGIQLSAFNLSLRGRKVESIFQSSKVFCNGKQYSFLIDYSPLEARKYVKQVASNEKLSHFIYNGQKYSSIPKTAFYDFIYCNALLEHKDLYKQIVEYDIFTDIEFNYQVSLNCQARSCCIFVYLYRTDRLSYISNYDKFIQVYEEIKYAEQLSFF